MISVKMMHTAVIYGDSEPEVESTEEIEEKKGKIGSSMEKDKLMRSVLENDKKTIKEGKLIKEALNSGLNSFMPDMIFEQLVSNYKIAKNIYGERLLRELTGYSPDYLSRNVKIPEFRKELKRSISNNVAELKKDGLADKEGTISDKGVKLASLILYTEELDKLMPKGFTGEKVLKKEFHYGDKEDVRNYHKGDRYRDIALKKTIQVAIRRNTSIEQSLRSFTRRSKGEVSLIYALDASGSMKGEKIEACKKAGIALAYRAIQEKDKVGLLVFGSKIKDEVRPTNDFKLLLDRMTRIRASKETDIAKTIEKAITLFPKEKVTKHLIIISDAMPTVGKSPEKNTLEAVSLAKSNGITISLIGIKLEEKAKKLAEKIVSISDGQIYFAETSKDVDQIVLTDYYKTKVL